MRVSASDGLGMQVSSSLRREDAEERDDEVDAEVGLEVAVRLTAAGRTDRARRHRGGGSDPGKQLLQIAGELTDQGARGATHVVGVSGRQVGMAVGWNLRDGKGNVLDAPGFGQGEAAALVDWQAAAEVRQREGALSVATVGGADQVEERVVLRDRQQLPFAEHPSGASEVYPE